MANLINASASYTNFPEVGTGRSDCTLQFEVTEVNCGQLKLAVPYGFADTQNAASEAYFSLLRSGLSFAILEISYVSPCSLSGFEFDLQSISNIPIDCKQIMGVFGAKITDTVGTTVGAAYNAGFSLYAEENKILGHYNPQTAGAPTYLPAAPTAQVLCYIVVGGTKCADFWSMDVCQQSQGAFSISGLKGTINQDDDGKSVLTEHLETWNPELVPPFPGAPTADVAAIYRLGRLITLNQYKERWDANGKDGETEDRILDIIDLVAFVNDRYNAFNKIRSKEIVPSYCCQDNADCTGELKIMCVECYPSSQRKEMERLRQQVGPCGDPTKREGAAGSYSVAAGINFNNAESGFNSPDLFSDKPLNKPVNLVPQDMVVTVAYRSSMPVSGFQFDIGYNAFGNKHCDNSGRVELPPALSGKWVGQSISIDDRFGYDRVTRVLAYQFPSEEVVRNFADQLNSPAGLSKMFLANSLPARQQFQGVVSFVIEGCIPIGCPCPEEYYCFATPVGSSKDPRFINNPKDAEKGDEYVGPVVYHDGEWWTANSVGAWTPDSRLLERKWKNMELLNSRIVSNFIRKGVEHPQQKLRYNGYNLTITKEIPTEYSSYEEYWREVINNIAAKKSLFNGLSSNPNFSTYESFSVSLIDDYKGYDIDANLDGKIDVADLLALVNLAQLRMIFPFQTGADGVPADADVGDNQGVSGDSSATAASSYAPTIYSDDTDIFKRLIRDAKFVPVYVCVDELCSCTLPDVCPDICDEDYDGALLNFSDRLDIPKNKGSEAIWRGNAAGVRFNPSLSVQMPFTIASVTTGTTTVITTSDPHGMSTGSRVTLANLTSNGNLHTNLNGVSVPITVTGINGFSIAIDSGSYTGTYVARSGTAIFNAEPYNEFGIKAANSGSRKFKLSKAPESFSNAAGTTTTSPFIPSNAHITAITKSTVSTVASVGTGNTTTINTSAAHGLSNGNTVIFSGFSGGTGAGNWARYNGFPLAVTVVDTDTFTVPIDTSSGHDAGLFQTTHARAYTPTIVTTAQAHGLNSGALIGLTGIKGTNSAWEYNLETNSARGRAFEADVLSATQFRILTNHSRLRNKATGAGPSAEGQLQYYPEYVNSSGWTGTFDSAATSTNGKVYHYFPSGTLLSNGSTLLRPAEEELTYSGEAMRTGQLHFMEEMAYAIMAGTNRLVGNHQARYNYINSQTNLAGVILNGFGEPRSGTLTFKSTTLADYDNETLTITTPNFRLGSTTKTYIFTDDAAEGATGNFHSSDGTSIVIQINGLNSKAAIATQFQLALSHHNGHNGMFDTSRATVSTHEVVTVTERVVAAGYSANSLGATIQDSSNADVVTVVPLGSVAGGNKGFSDFTVSAPVGSHKQALTLTNVAPGENGNSSIAYSSNDWQTGLWSAPALEFAGGTTYLSTMPDTFKDWSRYFYDIYGIGPQKLYDPRRLRHNGVSFFKVQLCVNSSDVHFVRDAIFTLDFCNAYDNIQTAFIDTDGSTGGPSSGTSHAKFYGFAGEGFEDLEFFDAGTGAKITAGTDGLYNIPAHGKVSVLVHNKADEDLFDRDKYQFDEHPSTAITHNGGQLTLARMFVTPLPDFENNKSIALLSGKNQRIGEAYGSITYRKRPRGTWNATLGKFTADDDTIWTTVQGEDGWLAVGPKSSFYTQFYDDNSASLHTYADYMLHVMAVGPRTIDVIYNSSKPFDRAIFPIGTWNGAEIEEIVDGYGVKNSSTHQDWTVSSHLNADVPDAQITSGMMLDPARWSEDGYSIVSVRPLPKGSNPSQLSGSGILCRIKFNKPVFEPEILRIAEKNFICPPIGTPNNLIVPDLSAQRKGEKDYPTGRDRDREREKVERDRKEQKYGDAEVTVISNGSHAEVDPYIVLHLDAASTKHYSYLSPSGSYTGDTDVDLDSWHGNPGPVFVSFGNTFVPLNTSDIVHKPKILGAAKSSNKFGAGYDAGGVTQGTNNSCVSFNTGDNATGAGLRHLTGSNFGHTAVAGKFSSGTAYIVAAVDDGTWDVNTNNRGVIAFGYSGDALEPFNWQLEVHYGSQAGKVKYRFALAGKDSSYNNVTANLDSPDLSIADVQKVNLISLQWDCDAGTMEMFINGTSVASNATLDIDSSHTSHTMNWALGYDPVVNADGPESATNTANQGNTAASQATLQYQLGEIMVMAGVVLDDEMRKKGEAYFANKWGLTARLDTTHPGYNTATQLTDSSQVSWNNSYRTNQEIDVESAQAIRELDRWISGDSRLDSDRCAAKWVSERVWIDKSNESLFRLKPED